MRIDKDNIEDVLIRAIREKGAMERMEALDRQMDAKVLAAKRRRTWLTSVAAACVLFVACGGTLQEVRLANQGEKYSYKMIQNEYSPRSESDDDDLLYEANRRLLSGDDISNNTLKDLEDRLSSLNLRLEKVLADTTGSSYLNYGLWETKYECEWYLSAVLLRSKSFHKSKKLLRKIAESDSPYSSQAASALNQLRFFCFRKENTKTSEVSFIQECGIKDPTSYDQSVIDSLIQTLPDSTKQSIIGDSGARIAEKLLYEAAFFN